MARQKIQIVHHFFPIIFHAGPSQSIIESEVVHVGWGFFASPVEVYNLNLSFAGHHNVGIAKISVQEASAVKILQRVLKPGQNVVDGVAIRRIFGYKLSQSDTFDSPHHNHSVKRSYLLRQYFRGITRFRDLGVKSKRICPVYELDNYVDLVDLF